MSRFRGNRRFDRIQNRLYTFSDAKLSPDTERRHIISTQSDYVYRELKNMIFHMVYLPGAKLTEQQLSDALKVSRTPVHDALRRLESDGLVRMEANRGAVVTLFTDEEIRELGTIRLSQDILSARLASYYGSVSDFDRLMSMAESCEQAAARGDVFQRIVQDAELHLEISRISRNARLVAQQEALYQQVHLVQISKYTDIENSIAQIHHHRPIIQAIRSHDLPEAERLICEHIRDFYQLDPYLLKCYGADKT